jgi:hypothetical protein
LKLNTSQTARFSKRKSQKTVSPEVGRLGAAYYQKALKIQPSLTVMFQWRRAAWNEAVAAL